MDANQITQVPPQPRLNENIRQSSEPSFRRYLLIHSPDDALVISDGIMLSFVTMLIRCMMGINRL